MLRYHLHTLPWKTSSNQLQPTIGIPIAAMLCPRSLRRCQIPPASPLLYYCKRQARARSTRIYLMNFKLFITLFTKGWNEIRNVALKLNVKCFTRRLCANRESERRQFAKWKRLVHRRVMFMRWVLLLELVAVVHECVSSNPFIRFIKIASNVSATTNFYNPTKANFLTTSRHSTFVCDVMEINLLCKTQVLVFISSISQCLFFGTKNESWMEQNVSTNLRAL